MCQRLPDARCGAGEKRTVSLLRKRAAVRQKQTANCRRGGADRENFQVTTSALKSLLEYWGWPANALPFQADIYFNTVGDLDEGNVAVHAVLFAIESHYACDAPGSCSLAVISDSEFFCFCDATDGKVAFQVERVWAGLNDFRRLERDYGRVFCVKEILAL